MKAKIQILCWLMSVILSSIQAFAGEIWYLKTENDAKNLTDYTQWTNSAGAGLSALYSRCGRGDRKGTALLHND